jgi:hypothetical protein
MKIWTISVLLSILLSLPAVCDATDPLDSGGARVYNYWFLEIPTGAGYEGKAPESSAAKEEGEAKPEETEEQKKQDKKVDDAIKKAWGG